MWNFFSTPSFFFFLNTYIVSEFIKSGESSLYLKKKKKTDRTTGHSFSSFFFTRFIFGKPRAFFVQADDISIILFFFYKCIKNRAVSSLIRHVKWRAAFAERLTLHPNYFQGHYDFWEIYLKYAGKWIEKFTDQGY